MGVIGKDLKVAHLLKLKLGIRISLALVVVIHKRINRIMYKNKIKKKMKSITKMKSLRNS